LADALRSLRMIRVGTWQPIRCGLNRSGAVGWRACLPFGLQSELAAAGGPSTL